MVVSFRVLRCQLSPPLCGGLHQDTIVRPSFLIYREKDARLLFTIELALCRTHKKLEGARHERDCRTRYVKLRLGESNMKRDIPWRSIVLCGLLLSSSCIPQSNHHDRAFVSARAGGHVSSLDGFENIYGSRFGFAPDIGVGVPLCHQLYIVGDATYFSKTGDYVWALPTFVRPGPLDFSQWNFNVGAEYDFEISEEYSLNASAGATFTSASEVFHNTYTGSESGPNAETETWTVRAFGYFGALTVERAFRSAPFSIFAQAGYSFMPLTIFEMTGNGGGTDASVGLRYYFRM